MNLKNQSVDAGVEGNGDFKKSTPSYELVVRKNQANQEHGAPHLILRKQLKDEQHNESVNPESESSSNAEEVGTKELSFAVSVAEYISSLHNHVQDDVNRVVDAIIEEESKFPTNLPKLDDQLALIYPGSDVQELPGSESLERGDGVDSAENKSANYTKKVEYEDL